MTADEFRLRFPHFAAALDEQAQRYSPPVVRTDPRLTKELEYIGRQERELRKVEAGIMSLLKEITPVGNNDD